MYLDKLPKSLSNSGFYLSLSWAVISKVGSSNSKKKSIRFIGIMFLFETMVFVAK